MTFKMISVFKIFFSSQWSKRVLLDKIWGQVHQNGRLLNAIHKQLTRGNLSGASDVNPEDFNLPLESHTAFQELEEKLQNKDRFRALVSDFLFCQSMPDPIGYVFTDLLLSQIYVSHFGSLMSIGLTHRSMD